MKKIIVLAAALLMGLQVNAQIVANAGYVHAFENITQHNYLLDENTTFRGSLDGVYAGANYYYSLDELVDGLAAVPGANLSMLFGRHYNFNKVSVRELALNLPLQASYTYEINDNLKVFGQTGPTLQFALSYKAKDEAGTLYPILKKDNKFGESRRPFNFYWGFAAGVEVIDMLRIELGVDFGFANLNRPVETNFITRIKRSYLHFGVGYLF